MTIQTNKVKHLYVEDILEQKFIDLFKDSKDVALTVNTTKKHPYYKAFVTDIGMPVLQKIGYTGASQYTRIRQKELDELSLIPGEARVHYLLSL